MAGQDTLTERALEFLQYERARSHPRYFLPHMTVPDSREGDTFHFATLLEHEAAELELPFLGKNIYRGLDPIGETSWIWQRYYLDWILENHFTVTLKARQLGISWIWDAVILWDIVFFPGVDDLVYSIKEEDAIEQINRIWDLWLTLPEHFKYGIKVLKPWGDARPGTRIELEHRDGRVSTVTGMPATKKAGHSRVARRVLFDEAAWQEYARQLWKALMPAASEGGWVGAVSTANGMSDEQGGGNFFHELYSGSGGPDYPKVRAKFLGVYTHPLRDEKWLSEQNMKAADKAEQFPTNDDEAFLLTGNPYFDLNALKYYSIDARVNPLYTFEWVVPSNNPKAAHQKREDGTPIAVYREPEKGRSYAVGCDLATGQGTDYSVAAVIDLHDGSPCAELRMKASYRDFTRQLHFLGRWYNTAIIAPEKQGGWGDVAIEYLRDGHEGRPPYPRIYRHRAYDDLQKSFKDQYGFPMHEKARAKIIAELDDWVNKRLFPWVTRRFSTEARTFVRRDTKPYVRAADGANDDTIIAWGIALELFAQFAKPDPQGHGGHKHDFKRSRVAGDKRSPEELAAIRKRAGVKTQAEIRASRIKRGLKVRT